MRRMGPCYIFLLLLFGQIRDNKAEDVLSSMLVYKLLSARIDGLVFETMNLKSELAETKAVVERIEEKIERIDDNVSLLANKMDNQGQTKHILSENDKSIPGSSELFSQRKFKTQAILIRKMLVNEKSHMRGKIKTFENRLKTFESNIKKKLMSFETDFNHSMTESLMFIENKVQNGDVETSKLIKEMNVNIESKFNDSETKANQVLSIVTSRLVNTKRRLINRLNSAESKLQTISLKQDTQVETTSGQISDLSRRIAVEEVRKVAFSARMNTHQKSFGKEETLVFDKVLYSYGGGYSSLTGIFTAPKSGTYLFTFNVEPFVGKQAYVHLMKGSQSLTSALADSEDKVLNGGNAGIVYVEAEEQVWIRTSNLRDNYYIYPYRTTFNGILID